MDSTVHQVLSASRLDTNVDTLTEKHGQFVRTLPSEFAMTKWPGYVKERSRMRFQLRIPNDVRHAFNGAEWIRIPLIFHTEREAQRSALSWYVIYQEEFAEIRYEAEHGKRAAPVVPLKKPLSEYTREEMRVLVQPISENLNRQQHTAISTGTLSFQELTESHEKLDIAVRDVLRGKGSTYLGILTELLLIFRGIPYDTKHQSFAEFMFESARVHRTQAIAPNSRRLAGDDVDPPPLPLVGAGLMIPTSKGLTLGAAIDGYIRALPDNHYKRKLVLCLKLFREAVGAALPVSGLKQTHVRDFLGMVCRLPKNAGVRYQQKGETLAQLLAEEDAEAISESTYRDNYRATLAKFLRESHETYGDDGFPQRAATAPYTGDRRGVQDKQRHLKEAELVRLFNGAEFRAIAQDPAQEARYWLPVIGLYTGARPREICQLNPQCDWGKEGDVWYLDLNENKPAGKGVTKSIKTGDARLVPLHPELVRLGLPTYLGKMKAAGADRLFPSFRVKGGNPYMAAGAEFSELLRATGLYDDVTKAEKVTGMYVFRKTFATNGDRQGVKVEPFIGHGESGKTMAQESYISSPTKNSEDMPYLYGAFKRLDFGVKVPMLGP
jgi:integrase